MLNQSDVNHPPFADLTGPTYDPNGEDMGESGLQFFVCHMLVELLTYYFEAHERPMLVSGNQYMYWDQAHPDLCIAPDVYVIPDETMRPQDVDLWRTWEHGGKGPSLAIEVVAKDPRRAAQDYAPEMLVKYQHLGVKELFRYDPHHGGGRRIGEQRRRLLTHWVRDGQGQLLEQPVPLRSKAKSTLYEFWMVHLAQRGLVLGMGNGGTMLWPTRAEAAALRALVEADRAEAEAQRTEAEADRAEAEANRAEAEANRAEAAEAREAALREELARLRAQRDPA